MSGGREGRSAPSWTSRRHPLILEERPKPGLRSSLSSFDTGSDTD